MKTLETVSCWMLTESHRGRQTAARPGSLRQGLARVGLQDTVFLDHSTGWAVGDGGGTYVTTDGGQTWNTRHSGTDEFIIGVDFVDERTGWAVGSGELPAEFGKRLVRMKQASGLTWFEFSEALGVELKQVLRWREGNGAMRRCLPFPRATRGVDTWRSRHPHGRGLPGTHQKGATKCHASAYNSEELSTR